VDRLKEMQWTYDADNSRLASNMLRSPCKVATLETEGPEFYVSTTNSDTMDALRADFGAGWLTAELELSLLAIVGALSTGLRTLVAR